MTGGAKGIGRAIARRLLDEGFRVALADKDAAALTPRAAISDDSDLHAPRPGVTLGGRAAYYRPKDAEHGTLNGGAQALDLHWSIDGSYRGAELPILASRGRILPIPQNAVLEEEL